MAVENGKLYTAIVLQGGGGRRARDEADADRRRGDQGNHRCHQQCDLRVKMSHSGHFLLSVALTGLPAGLSDGINPEKGACLSGGR